LVGYAIIWLMVPMLMRGLLRRRTMFINNAFVDGLTLPGDLLIAGLGILIALDSRSISIFVLIMGTWILGVYLRRSVIKQISSLDPDRGRGCSRGR